MRKFRDKHKDACQVDLDITIFLSLLKYERFSHAVIFLTSATKFNIEPNGVIFDVSPKMTARHPM